MNSRRWACGLLLAATATAFAQPACGLGALPSGRFIDNGDGTVTDRSSKLTWMRCAVGQAWAEGSCRGEAQRHAWAAAPAAAEAVNRRGDFFFSDWRVPLLRELATLVERECAPPRLHAGAFPVAPIGPYWTATSRAGEGVPDLAYTIGFGADGISIRRKDEAFVVRLVRSAS